MIALLNLIACTENPTGQASAKSSPIEDLCNGIDDDNDGQVDEDAVVFDLYDANGLSDDTFESDAPAHVAEPDLRLSDMGFIFPAGDVDHLLFDFDDTWWPGAMRVDARLQGPPGTTVQIVRQTEGGIEVLTQDTINRYFDRETGESMTWVSAVLDNIFADDTGRFGFRIFADEPSCSEPFLLEARFVEPY